MGWFDYVRSLINVSMKVCLVGAGASYGYGTRDENSLSDVFCPPISDGIFIRGIRLGILSEDEFPFLYKSLQIRLDTEEKLEELNENRLKIDIEEFLVWVIESSGGGVNPDVVNYPPEMRPSNFSRESYVLGMSIGEIYRFIYDFFRLFSLLYSPQLFVDNYRDLVKSTKSDEICYISLNYDVLLEMALSFESVPYVSTIRQPGTPVLKPHGSIDQLYPNAMQASRPLFHHGRSQGNTIVSPIDGGTYREKRMQITLKEVITHPYWRLPPSRHPFDKLPQVDFMPAVVPPFGDNKERHLFGLNTIWEEIETVLRQTDELIIIGCSLRPQDKLLRKSLKENLKDSIVAHIVCGRQSEKIESEFENWYTDPSCHVYGYFHQYLEE